MTLAVKVALNPNIPNQHHGSVDCWDKKREMLCLDHGDVLSPLFLEHNSYTYLFLIFANFLAHLCRLYLSRYFLILYSIDAHFDATTTEFCWKYCGKQTAFENIVGKGGIARNEQFLLFPQRFLFDHILVYPFIHIFGHHIFICCWMGREPKLTYQVIVNSIVVGNVTTSGWHRSRVDYSECAVWSWLRLHWRFRNFIWNI